MERGWAASRKEDTVVAEDFGGGAAVVLVLVLVVSCSLPDICAVQGDVMAEGTESEVALDVPKGVLVGSGW